MDVFISVSVGSPTISQRESFSTDRFPTTFFRKKIGGGEDFFQNKRWAQTCYRIKLGGEDLIFEKIKGAKTFLQNLKIQDIIFQKSHF